MASALTLSAISRLHSNDQVRRPNYEPQQTRKHTRIKSPRPHCSELSHFYHGSELVLPSLPSPSPPTLLPLQRHTKKGDRQFRPTMFLLRSAAFLGMQLGPYLMESVLIAALRQQTPQREVSGIENRTSHRQTPSDP